MTRLLSRWAVGLVWLLGSAAGAQDSPYAQMKAYDFQSRKAVDAVVKLIQQAGQDATKLSEIEVGLISVLDDPAAAFAGKQEACKLLLGIGTAACVPSVARLLADEKTADIARYALERNASKEASTALRSALSTLKGKALVGVLNTIGHRGDPKAVGAIRPLVADPDPLVADAAVAALGGIGSEDAMRVLRSLPVDDLRSGQAMVRCAEKMLSLGRKAGAQRAFTALAAAGRHPIVRAASLRALSSAQGPKSASLAIAALSAPEPYLQRVAARVCGSLTSPSSVAQCIQAFPGVAPELQVIVLTAWADRKETRAADVTLEATKSPDADVRVAAIQALHVLGGPKGTARLIELVTKGEGSDRDAARASLAAMPGKDTEAAVLTVFRDGAESDRLAVIDVLTERPSAAVRAALSDAAKSTNKALAVASIRALGRVGAGSELATMVGLVASGDADEVREAAQGAVVAISQRTEDPGGATTTVVGAMSNAPGAGKAALLQVLAEIGGDAALAELTKACTGADAESKRAAVAALAESWSDQRALPLLLSAAQTESDAGLKIRSMRGYFRLVGQDDRSPADERVGRVRDGLRAATRPEEKRQGLSILRRCRTASSVAAAAELLADAGVRTDAADVILYLAAPQRVDNRDLPAVAGPEVLAALDKLIGSDLDETLRQTASKLKG